MALPEQFRTLIIHFFGRFFDRDSISPDADERANVVQIVALLTVPGAFISLFMFADHAATVRSEFLRTWLRSGDRYMLVCYAMVVMGFVMVFKWDSLFPDRRDYLILTSLPISLKQMFTARVIALGAFLLFFVVAINVFSCLIVPWVYGVRVNSLAAVLPAFAAHSTAVLGASVFTALFFAAFQGVLINLMTPAAFRRLSPWIQMVSMAILVTMLLLIPGISSNIRLLAESNSRILDWVPVFWFMGIYEILNPEGTLIPASYIWARTAVDAMAIAGVVFVLSYLIGYHRYSKKVLEGVESDVFTPRWWQRGAASILNAVLLRRPRQRASFYFIGRIFGRSAKHRLFIAMYSGIGLALMVSSLFVLRRGTGATLWISASGLREAPLILSFFVVSGLRATFNVPYELGANWMFQVTTAVSATEYLKATKRWVLLRGIVPLYALIAPFEFTFFEPAEAVFHLAFGLMISALLIEVFFFSFNKIPFTCSYFPAKSHMAFLAGAYLYGFTTYAFTMAGLERWAGASPLHMTLFFAGSAALLSAPYLYRRHTGEYALRIVYEEEKEPEVRQLDLV